MKVRARSREHFKDVQDFEFTIEEGKLFMLQTRNGKRTGLAALKYRRGHGRGEAHRLEDALMRIQPDQLDQLLRADLRPRRSQGGDEAGSANGLPAGPGAASGKIVFNADAAPWAAAKGEKVLLVRNETTPEDLRGMIAAEGILTAQGGVSSHAALVARQMGKVCVCGCGALRDRLRRRAASPSAADRQGRRLHLASTAPPARSSRRSSRRARPEIIQVLLEKSMAPEDAEKFQLLRRAHEVGRQGHARSTSAPTPTQPEQSAERHRVRRRRHRPHPHRAHVLRRRPHRRDARDDPRRDARGAARPRSPSSCPISATTSSASSRR